MKLSILRKIKRAKYAATSVTKKFNLAKYLKANNIELDLSKWHIIEEEKSTSYSCSISTESGNESETELSMLFYPAKEKTPEELIESILAECILEDLTLPLFSKITYSRCIIRNCNFVVAGASCEGLTFYNCDIENVFFSSIPLLLSVDIDNSKVNGMLISGCILKSLRLTNCYTSDEPRSPSTKKYLKNFHLKNCQVEETSIKNVSFCAISRFNNNAFIDMFEIVNSNLVMDGTNNNQFGCLHKVKNLGCPGLDLYINEMKIQAATTNGATVVAIPYSMNGTTTNTDNLLTLLIMRGGYVSEMNRATLNYIIYINNTEELDDTKKGYLDRCQLCVLPGGENVPGQYYIRDQHIKDFLKDGTYNIELIDDDRLRFDDPRTNTELKVLDYLKDKPAIKVVGICRGLQIMAVFCGATISNCHERHSENPANHYMFVDTSTAGNPILSLFEAKKQKAYCRLVSNDEDQTIGVKVNCQHSQQVSATDLPKAVKPLAWSKRDTCPDALVIEACGFAINPNWFAIQNHPESIAIRGKDKDDDAGMASAIVRRLIMSPNSSKKKYPAFSHG